MSVAGRLALTVDWDGRRVVAARVDSTRPQAARLLVGRKPEEAAALVPLLFSLCGQAQGVAARLACAAAAGTLPSGGTAAAEAVRREAVGEHLWRLLLDWPELLGVGRRDGLFAETRRRLASSGGEPDEGVLAALLADDVLGLAPAEWLVLDARERDSWRNESPALGAELLRALTDGLPASIPSLLPPQGAADWAVEPLDADYAAAPSWRGGPAETGVLARQVGQPMAADYLVAGRNVAARLAARLAELAELAAGVADDAHWVDAAAPDPGVGIARVETARGTLVHRVRLAAGRVADYVIVAPTEWNFRPGGAFCREIEGVAAADAKAARIAAARLALALDPCVDYEVKVNHA